MLVMEANMDGKDTIDGFEVSRGCWSSSPTRLSATIENGHQNQLDDNGYSNARRLRSRRRKIVVARSPLYRSAPVVTFPVKAAGLCCWR